MAELFRFFDSVADDPREYGSEDFAEYFNHFVSNGVFEGGENLKIKTNNVGMQTYATPGTAWINGYFYKNTEDLTLVHSPAHANLKRIDRIVLRLDFGQRNMRLSVLTGTPADNPQPPALTRTNIIYELSLAQVHVHEAVTSIASARVVDERDNPDVCGITHIVTKDDLNQKVDKVSGKGLSTNDYTNAEKNKLSNHVDDKSNPHEVTKSQVGLGDVDNVKQASQTEFDSVLRGTSVSIGRDANSASAAGSNSIAVGQDASAEGDYAIALGRDASAEGYGSIALGWMASATEVDAIVLGREASATEDDAIVLGWMASAGFGSIAIGSNSSATKDDSIALGWMASATGYSSIAIGGGASAENSGEGILGSTGSSDTSNWKVPGNFTVSGTKNFEIPHPKPEKQATHVIRHGAVESPTAGDTLYRYRVTATKDNDIVTIDLPDYFVYLSKDVQIFVTGQGHFGNGYGSLNREAEQLEIHCQYEGEYNVLVIGTRNDDHDSVQNWSIKGVEREIGESWTGETYVFSVDEIMEVEEIKEVS